MLDVSSNGTVFVTFSDRKLDVCLNWARHRRGCGRVGVSERLDEATERAIRGGASLFCAEKADMMVANGQQGAGPRPSPSFGWRA